MIEDPSESAKLGNSRHGLPDFNISHDTDSAGTEGLDTYPCGSDCFGIWERELPCSRRW